jgi:predicted MFS family arabinose efflux permease
LLFADAGLSAAQISLLFAIWSAVGLVAEVPSGMLADRFSRRGCLVVGGLLQAVAYAAWVLWPEFGGFAAGFALWGIGGSFVSGASEALLYDGLTARGAEDRFPDLLGRVTAVGLLAQVPSAIAASVLFSLGSYALVGWASVITCVAASAAAWRLTELPGDGREDLEGVDDGDDGDVMAAPDPDEPPLRQALRDVAHRPAVRIAVLAVAALTGLDAFEEYVPLLAADWGVAEKAIPVLGLGLPLAGALGAALGGRWSGRRSPGEMWLGLLLGVAGVVLAAAALVHAPLGLLAVFAFYGVYSAVLVVAGARLQQRLEGRSRATVTSVAALLSEFAAFAVYLAYAFGAALAVAGLVLLVAAALPWLLREDVDREVGRRSYRSGGRSGP